MELFQEMLIHALMNGEMTISIRGKDADIEAILENKCYQALKKIKAIITDDCLEDKECFMRIEKILHIFEEIGSNGGNRHDFG